MDKKNHEDKIKDGLKFQFTDEKHQDNIPFWRKKSEQKKFLKKQFQRQMFISRKKGIPFGRRGI